MFGTDPIARAFESQLRLLEPLREHGWSEFQPWIFAGVTTASVPTVNGVVVWGDATDLDYLRDALRRVAAAGYPHSFMVRGTAAAEFETLAREFELDRVEDVRVMTLERIERLRPIVPPQLNLRELNADDVSVHCEMTDQIFEMAPGTTELVCPLAAFDLPDVRAYAGVVDGEVVCTAMSITADGVTWIYDVGTVAEARGHGYGGAITAHAVSEAARAGATMAVLQTSEDGYPVYRRLGFEHTESWTLWVSGAD